MTTSSTSLPSRNGQGSGVPGWVRSISPRRAGIIVILLAILFTIVSYILQASLNYPAVLLDKPSLVASLVAQGSIAVVLGFVGLLLCGVLLLIVSLGLVSHLEGNRRGRVIVTGGASGTFWAVSALLGLALVPLWSGAQTGVAQVLATILLLLAEIAAPLLLIIWTVTLAQQFRMHRVLGWVSAIGLLLVFLRSLVWTLNALLPIESGYYGTAGLLAVLAVLGESLWLVWLFLFGFHLMRTHGTTPQLAPVEDAERPKSEEEGKDA